MAKIKITLEDVGNEVVMKVRPKRFSDPCTQAEAVALLVHTICTLHAGNPLAKQEIEDLIVRYMEGN